MSPMTRLSLANLRVFFDLELFFDLDFFLLTIYIYYIVDKVSVKVCLSITEGSGPIYII